MTTTSTTQNMEQEVLRGQEPAWYQLLSESKASQIVPKRPLIYVSYTEDVGTLLKKLSEANVVSAIITDPEKPGVFGFVDVFDLLVYVLEVTNQSTDITKESIQNLKWEGKCFARAEAGPLTNLSQTDPYVTIAEDTSLLEMVKVLAGEVHRLAVVDKVQKERVLNVVSQSDVVKFLTKRGVWIGSKLEKPISEVGLGPLGVSAVRDETPTVEVLRYMKRLSVRGVAVVDKNNRLIANFSATDLLGLTEENFPLLALSVKDFLYRMYGFPKPPVFCKINDSVETLMLKFAVHKVHRIYLVNDTMQPGGIVTLTDIMQFLLAA